MMQRWKTLPEDGLEEEQQAKTRQLRPRKAQRRTLKPGYWHNLIACIAQLYVSRIILRAEDLVQETMLKAFRFATPINRDKLTCLALSYPEHFCDKSLSTFGLSSNTRITTRRRGVYLYNQIRDLSGQELSQGAEDEVLNKYLDEDVYEALNDLPLNFVWLLC